MKLLFATSPNPYQNLEHSNWVHASTMRTTWPHYLIYFLGGNSPFWQQQPSSAALSPGKLSSNMVWMYACYMTGDSALHNTGNAAIRIPHVQLVWWNLNKEQKEENKKGGWGGRGGNEREDGKRKRGAPEWLSLLAKDRRIHVPTASVSQALKILILCKGCSGI